MDAVQSMPEPKKMVPKKSTWPTPSSPSIDKQTLSKKDDTFTLAKSTLEEKSQRSL